MLWNYSRIICVCCTLIQKSTFFRLAFILSVFIAVEITHFNNVKIYMVQMCYLTTFFRTNKWISTGKTLIIGYDVCHPEPQPRHERRMRMPPTQPSISFNGASCPETFIGDYSFQEPRKEQVTSSILEERIYWILSLFYGSRNGMLPETVIITRDGVSEGQFKMVRF
ncbi:unnamed protein product [Brugia timori]|uniref:Piwi domain-containing protein n=1 Tax=Brugia timori TaxID=42155 RepID=A0A0R3QDY2_9BILA|nr:unnamed protein product [Brugia timori]